ncbi:hypothetical protein ACCO45_003272 [Purpureocillium lilacinum]|uniref:Uncharacterized protein n=1 Tax=Purpureocillium lilacinum TaxID=33203 RepID=A0ACC4E0T7_PURLI
MPAPCSVVPLGTRSAARVAEAISGRWRREGHAQRQARTLAHQEQAIKSVLLGGKRRIQPPVAPLAPAPTLLCAASPGVFGPAAAFETPEHNFVRRQEALPLREGLGTLAYDVMWYSEKVEEAGARRGVGGEQAGNGEDDVISFDTTPEDCTVLCSAVQDGTVPDWNEALALAGAGPDGGAGAGAGAGAGTASLEPRPAPSQDRAQRAKANTTTPCGKSRTECVYWQSRSYEVQTAARLAGHLSGETCPPAPPPRRGRGPLLRSCAAAALV